MSPNTSPDMITIDRLRPDDREAWGRLAAGYKRFYNTRTTEAEFERAWQRLQTGDGVWAFGARDGGPKHRLVGIVHYLFHASTWSTDNCYLQDLFTDPDERGRGVARALIDAVAAEARAHGSTRLYWLTQETNRTARTLYDKVAAFKGFIRYDHPMP
jgi:GNAT superfamily N-acetyltransferase